MKAMKEHNKIFEELMRNMCHELREINVMIKKVEADQQDKPSPTSFKEGCSEMTELFKVINVRNVGHKISEK